MPPEVVSELLGSTVHLPPPQHVERFMVHEEDAARPVARSVGERADVYAFRPAVDGVRPRIAGALGELLAFDRPDELGLRGVRLGVEDVKARGPDTRNHEITTLDMRVGCVRAQA